MKELDCASKQRDAETELPENRGALEVRYYGLCSTCNHSGGCTLQKDPESPVLFCEEFDSSSHKETVYRPVQVVLPLKPPEEAQGLCINCDKRAECSFKKREGGVWSCDEYA